MNDGYYIRDRGTFIELRQKRFQHLKYKPECDVVAVATNMLDMSRMRKMINEG